MVIQNYCCDKKSLELLSVCACLQWMHRDTPWVATALGKVVCLKDCVLFCTWLHHNVWLGCDIDRRRNGRPHDWGVLLLSQDGHLLLLLSEDGHW